MVRFFRQENILGVPQKSQGVLNWLKRCIKVCNKKFEVRCLAFLDTFFRDFKTQMISVEFPLI